jgi:hypothetical protein
MRDTIKGRFKPKNPGKYKGNANNIIYRSSWEKTVYNWFDTNPNVLHWSSEEIVIPYYNPFDRKAHRYFPDALICVKSNAGVRECLIEIKPEQHSIRPIKRRGQKKKTYTENVLRYYVNAIKWHAAQKYCYDRQWEFMILCKQEDSERFIVRKDLLEMALIDAERLLVGGQLTL